MNIRRAQASLALFRVLELCAAFVFFWAVAHHVYNFDFRPLAAFSLYGILVCYGVTFNPSKPSPVGLWLLLFIAPYALMQIGFLCFMRVVWIISPQFFRRTGAFELRRRIQQ